MVKHIFFVGCTIFSFSACSQTFKVEEYGAKTGINHDNTRAIQDAIDACSSLGGGVVLLSEGLYLSGTIELKNDVGLCIKPGSTLKAIADTSKIQKVSSTIISRLDVVPWKAFVFAQSSKNIRVFGGGIIDASGGELCFLDGIENSPNRHYGLFLIDSKNITVEDLDLRSSAFWMQRYFNCSEVRLKSLRVFNHANKNNDGIDIDSSEDVIISDCLVDASDDAIVIKSNGENPSKNIVISNCTISSHASALKFGTGSVGGFENISISNIVIRRSKSKEMVHPLGIWGGLTGIELLTTDGGPMRQVTISNVIMEDVQNPIHVRLGNRLSGNVAKQGYGGSSDEQQGVKASNISAQVREEFVLEDVIISNVLAKNVGPYPVIIAGHSGHPVKRITLRDITIVSGKPGSSDDLTIPPSWKADGYPGRGMYGTRLPAYGIVTNFTEELKIENFRAIPAPGDPRPMERHYQN